MADRTCSWILAPLAAGVLQCGFGLPESQRNQETAAATPTAVIVLPDDGPQEILEALAGARRRIWIEMYLLTDPRVLDVLATARAAGADVRVLLEPSPYGDATANQPAFAALAQDGIDVRWFAVPGGLVHIKLLLIDDRAFILTPNLTASGLGRNREYAVVDRTPADVSRAESVWLADAVGAAPPEAPSGTRVVVSPIDARQRLTGGIDGAASSIAIEVEEISDGDLVARLIEAHARGVAVTVMVPWANRSEATNQSVTRMLTGGVGVRALGTPTLHAKAMVIDDRLAFLGSVNFTRAALDDNREMGVLLDDAAVVSRTRATLDDDWIGAVLP